jgi:hypothetical protein
MKHPVGQAIVPGTGADGDGARTADPGGLHSVTASTVPASMLTARDRDRAAATSAARQASSSSVRPTLGTGKSRLRWQTRAQRLTGPR